MQPAPPPIPDGPGSGLAEQSDLTSNILRLSPCRSARMLLRADHLHLPTRAEEIANWLSISWLLPSRPDGQRPLCRSALFLSSGVVSLHGECLRIGG